MSEEQTITKEPEGEQKPKEWEPRIIGFLCNWCTYAGADLAGSSRLKYPPNVRVVRVPCSGRVNPMFVLKAFERGFDGVLVSGCHPGDCHYSKGNYYTRRRLMLLQRFLEQIGIEPERFHFDWISAAEGQKFAEVVEQFTEQVRKAGPFSGVGIVR
jgi:F420-non-reducing hydrogenase iron-sulfur subunit